MADYVAEHFSTEEKYMDHYQYHSSQSHKEEHQRFVQDILAFQEGCLEGRVPLTLKMLDFLKSWLINHTLNSDMKMAKYLLDKIREDIE